jgi:hypothetical protein
VVLNFHCGRATEADLLTVRDILWESPGKRRVELCFTGEGPRWDGGRKLRLLPGEEFCVAWNAELENKLAPWLKH